MIGIEVLHVLGIALIVFGLIGFYMFMGTLPTPNKEQVTIMSLHEEAKKNAEEMRKDALTYNEKQMHQCEIDLVGAKAPESVRHLLGFPGPSTDILDAVPREALQEHKLSDFETIITGVIILPPFGPVNEKVPENERLIKNSDGVYEIYRKGNKNNDKT